MSTQIMGRRAAPKNEREDELKHRYKLEYLGVSGDVTLTGTWTFCSDGIQLDRLIRFLVEKTQARMDRIKITVEPA
jgi:hypothetical protein